MPFQYTVAQERDENSGYPFISTGFSNPQVYPKLNTNPAGYVNQVNSFGVNLLKMKVFLLC